jgi:Tol biopolymer transport system component
MNPILISLTLFLASLSSAFALDTMVQGGNIYLSQGNAPKVQLTASGKDRSPVLCADKQCIVFIRKSSQSIDYAIDDPDHAPSKDELLADQIWIVDLITKKERLLVKDKISDDDRSKQISHIFDDSLKFSPDGKTLYFITDATVTSGAVHAVNIDGSNEHFIDSSNSIDVITKGQYKGDLILYQHRYFLPGGSYDWYYVFTPDDHEVGPLGDDLKNVNWDILYEDSEGKKLK